MPRNISQSLRLISFLLGRILARPAWLMALFLLLACMIPFAGGTRPVRSDTYQVLDAFGFSLLTPSRRAFNPHSMLSLAGLFIIPAALIYWRQLEVHLIEIGNRSALKGGILPLAAFSLYAMFLLLSLPLVARAESFTGPLALGTAVLDLIILAIMMAWAVDFALNLTDQERHRPLVGWMVAGALHLARGMTDAFLIAPQARELVEADWTTIAWHALLAIIAVTLHALPIPVLKSRATL